MVRVWVRVRVRVKVRVRVRVTVLVGVRVDQFAHAPVLVQVAREGGVGSSITPLDSQPGWRP
jgi:hypothetical protein